MVQLLGASLCVHICMIIAVSMYVCVPEAFVLLLQWLLKKCLGALLQNLCRASVTNERKKEF